MQTGDKYFDSREFRDILTAYTKAIEAGQPIFMDIEELTDIADYYNYIGDKEKANSAINLAMELNPGAAPPLVFKAREALDKEDVETAERLAEAIFDKEDPDYKYLQAEIMISQDKIDEAESYLQEAVKTIEPEERDDFAIDVTSIYIDYGVNDKAQEWLEQCENHERNEYKELMARIMFGNGKFKDSMNLFNELIDDNPYAKHYWNALANAQFMDEDYSGAITSSEYAIAIDPSDAQGLQTKANSLYKTGNYKEALEYYMRYNKQMPDDGFGELNIGSCLLNTSKYEEAIDHLNKAVNIAKNTDADYLSQIYQELAFAYSAMKMPEKAIEYIDMTKSDNDDDDADINVLRGHILLENGQDEEAGEMFRNAIIGSKNAPNIILRIIVSLYDNRFLETSYKMFKKFFAVIDGDFNDGYSYMALCCWDMKKGSEFLHYLKMAVEKNPREARIVLDHIFPKDMKPEAFYNYIYNKLNKDKQQ